MYDEIIDAAEVDERHALTTTSEAPKNFLCGEKARVEFEMGFFRHGGPEIILSPKQKNPETKLINQEVLLQFPGCTVYLMYEGEALEVAKGKFTIARVLDKSVAIATIIKAGDLQWPLTKDEPVVKLDSLNYLFSLPLVDGGSLSYGVTFSEQYRSSLSSLDSFLSEHSCFSASTAIRTKNIDWKEFAPRIEDYNNVLAKAIAQGTGQIVKGIFMCSNIYSTQNIGRDTSHLNLNYLNSEESWEKQVRDVGEMLLTRGAEEENGFKAREIERNTNGGDTNKSRANKRLKRVRNLSKMTENLSKATLDVVEAATGSVMTPMVNSQAGKKLLASVPGEVLFASLDAVNKILSAAEVAEIQVLSATTIATSRIVTDRFGENAGEITEDMLATTGQCTNTAWNLIKIRKAINPASYVSTGILRNAGKERI
uniref:Senescence domain-containing protein n=1 Tax=Salix viminalis TaxID=40686 RepID=A0A6N2N7A7_SALVM